MHEVVNAVAARIHPRDEFRPRHRTLRRNRGGQRREPTRLGEALEVGELALRHKPPSEFVVHAVEAEHDHSPAGRSGAATCRARQCDHEQHT